MGLTPPPSRKLSMAERVGCAGGRGFLYTYEQFTISNASYHDMSIIQNNFLNKNLSTLCVQKLAFICVCFDVVSGQNASLIDKMGNLAPK